MEKRKKLLFVGVLLLVFAAVKVGALVWWQERQPAAKAAACDVRRGCTLPNGVYVKFGGTGAAKQPFDVELKDVPAAVCAAGRRRMDGRTDTPAVLRGKPPRLSGGHLYRRRSVPSGIQRALTPISATAPV